MTIFTGSDEIMQFVVFPVLLLVEVAQNQSWTRDNLLASLQRNRVSGTTLKKKMFRSRCLNRVATTNIVIMQ